jgi:hypothetical protein
MYENKLLIALFCDGLAWVHAFDETLAFITINRYHPVEELSQNVQERIAALSMLNDGESIPGVGKRLKDNFFEVIDDGNDSGSQGESQGTQSS